MSQKHAHSTFLLSQSGSYAVRKRLARKIEGGGKRALTDGAVEIVPNRTGQIAAAQQQAGPGYTRQAVLAIRAAQAVLRAGCHQLDYKAMAR